MKRTMIVSAATAVLAAPAFAEPDCTAAAAAARPMWEVVKGFEEAGGTVAVAKTTGDKCYEIYGHQNEKKVEIYFDPATGEELDREEG